MIKKEWWILSEYGIYNGEFRPSYIRMGFNTYSEALNFAIANFNGYFKISGIECMYYDEMEINEDEF